MEELGKELDALMSSKLNVIEEAATLSANEAATGEYLVCLFLLLVDDERYGPHQDVVRQQFLGGRAGVPQQRPDGQEADDGFCSGDRRCEAQALGEWLVGRGLCGDKGTRVCRLLCLWEEAPWGMQVFFPT